MSKLILTAGLAASTPSTGQVALYAKSDNKLYVKNDAGAEAVLAAPVTDSLDAGTGEVILQGVGIASAVNYIQASNALGSAHPSLSAVGSDTNINLVLSPKGTGVIDVDTSVISNVADAVAMTDAVNMQFANANYAAIAHNHSGVYSEVGHLHTEYLALTGGTMTGAITLPGDPTAGLHAATKSYVDLFNQTASGTIQIQDIVGAMVIGNTETGIAVTYDSIGKKLNFDTNDFTITLSGDVTGSATVTDLGSVNITATVADDSHSHDLVYYNKTAADARIVELRGQSSIVVHTGGGPVSLTSTNHVFVVNQAVAGPITVNLPLGSGIDLGKLYQIKDGKGDASVNNITVSATGGDTIDSQPAVIMNSDYQNISLIWNGTEWNLL